VVDLDTHVLVFALAGTVSPQERRLLAGNTWSISAIVFWELSKLVQLGRASA
jgi:PIN domain nuclease of toxin-antitoxin system